MWSRSQQCKMYVHQDEKNRKDWGDKVTKDDYRDRYYYYLTEALDSIAGIGGTSFPVPVGDGEDRTWLIGKLQNDGFEVLPFGDESPLNQFVLVMWL